VKLFVILPACAVDPVTGVQQHIADRAGRAKGDEETHLWSAIGYDDEP
jgi:hypothetical protein